MKVQGKNDLEEHTELNKSKVVEDDETYGKKRAFAGIHANALS